MRESSFWRSIKAGLLKETNDIFLERIESCNAPDVFYCRRGYVGWIELKYLKKYPVKQLKISHFTPGQKLWLKTLTRKGGKAYLLLRVEKDTFIIDGSFSFNLEVTKEWLIENSLFCWFNKINFSQLLRILEEDYFFDE